MGAFEQLLVRLYVDTQAYILFSPLFWEETYSPFCTTIKNKSPNNRFHLYCNVLVMSCVLRVEPCPLTRLFYVQ